MKTMQPMFFNKIKKSQSEEEQISIAEDDWRLLLFIENPTEIIEAIIQIHLL
jgi:hypothetical protein